MAYTPQIQGDFISFVDQDAAPGAATGGVPVAMGAVMAMPAPVYDSARRRQPLNTAGTGRAARLAAINALTQRPAPQQ